MQPFTEQGLTSH